MVESCGVMKGKNVEREERRVKLENRGREGDESMI